MEVSLIGSSQAKIGAVDVAHKDVRFCSNLSTQNFTLKSRISFAQKIRCEPRSPIRLSLKAAAPSEVPVADRVRRKLSTSRAGRNPSNRLSLYVGLPLDAVSDCNTIKHARAIAAGLRALKLLGVDGVELPLWWGLTEGKAMGKYDFSGYLALAEMVVKMGLKLHVSLCFHASREPKIPLPEWVSRLGESQPSIFFTDRSPQQYRECLSLAVDDLPVLNGKTPVDVYGEFCKSFKSSFSPFLGSTITGVTISLGPNGELRYPSHHRVAKVNRIPGVGVFQCYDKYMLSHLKQHAETSGQPFWGLTGPHDAPNHDQAPNSSNFFKEHGGSWETPYGNFFLSWYSSQLLSHGDRLLSLASSTFADTKVGIFGRIPLVHSWFKSRCHPAELTAGFHSTVNRDGYEYVVEIFAKNSRRMIVPGTDLSDEHEPREALSSPKSLREQIMRACRKHGVEVSGENLSFSVGPGSFKQIEKNLFDENKVVDLFTYQRMGAYFFSPEHFSKFSRFVQGLEKLKLLLDDLPSFGTENLKSGSSERSMNLHTQASYLEL